MIKKILHKPSIFVLICTLLMSTSIWANQTILAIHSYHDEHLWTRFIKQGIDTTFINDKSIVIYHEYLDTKRHPNTHYESSFTEYINQKYNSTPIDSIIVSDDAALNLIRKHKAYIFPNVPVIYLGINNIDQTLIDQKDFTGVFENRDLGISVLDIKKLTTSDDIIVITDTSPSGKANLLKVLSVKDHHEAPTKFHIINDLSPKDIKSNIGYYSKTIPILKIGQLVNDSTRQSLLDWNSGTRQLSSQLENPIFTLSSTSIQSGATGFYELNGIRHGIQAAELVKKVLSGTDVNTIPPIIKAKSIWTFDWEKIQHFGFNESNIPNESTLINKDEDFYQKYKTLVWGTILVFSVAFFIIILLSELIRRGHQTQKILAENEDRYRGLARAGANIFWEFDTTYTITYISGDTRLLLGKHASQLLGNDINSLLLNNDNIDFPYQEFVDTTSVQKAIDNLLFNRRLSRNEIKVLVMNGSPMYDKNKKHIGYRGICNDVTVQQKLSERLAYQAAYDPLTGLINRESFNTRLKNQVDQFRLLNQSSYVCFLDLDRFKLVNDTAGHLVGDAMLAQIADVILACLEHEDILARLGGDEFGILFKDCDLTYVQSVCEDIIETINRFRFSWQNREFSVGISIGVVAFSKNLSETELLSKADLSCYKAKEQGRNRVYIADPDNKDLYDEELQMGYIANVAQAIERNQFYLVKQAIVATEENVKHLHYEILVRFKDENGKIVPPSLFIPAAEKHGVISLIDYWVISTAFENYDRFFAPKTYISVNLSGLSLSSEDFIKRVKTLVYSSGINPNYICFEITETAVISNLSRALEFIDQLKKIGIKFALDDFGSGASSFGYLKQLPVDFLKIDGSLVKNILEEPVDYEIISSIHGIARMMKMKTIAEFVENESIRKELAKIGVDYAQGYGIGKPINCE